MSLRRSLNSVVGGTATPHLVRSLIGGAREAAETVGTSRARRLTPMLAAIHFDQARSVAEVSPVAALVAVLVEAVDRGSLNAVPHDREVLLDRAHQVALDLRAKLESDIATSPDDPVTAEAFTLAAHLADLLVEAHMTYATVDSFELYALVGVLVAALLSTR